RTQPAAGRARSDAAGPGVGAPDPFLAGPTGRGGRRFLRFAARASTAVGEHPQSSRQCRGEVRPAGRREELAAPPRLNTNAAARTSSSGGCVRVQEDLVFSSRPRGGQIRGLDVGERGRNPVNGAGGPSGGRT